MVLHLPHIIDKKITLEISEIVIILNTLFEFDTKNT